MERPLVICLTPVKDEAWILERFLRCASVWADRIIIADQQSNDQSREIARRFPKVTLIENKSEAYNETDRQQLLINEARKIPGPKILMTLDADEFLTANFMTSPEWETILRSPPGTVVRFQRPELFAGGSGLCYFDYSWDLPIGLVDDGSKHKGLAVHSPRIPLKAGGSAIIPTQIKLMHFCLLDRERFKSRIRWYQCFEHVNLRKTPIELYRFYHQDLLLACSAPASVPEEWVQGYEQRGIDMSSAHCLGAYRWDKEVLQLFGKYGTARFKRLDIWDANWSQLHRELYPQEPGKTISDPRKLVHKAVHKWLRWTQPDFCLHEKRRTGRVLLCQAVQKALAIWGW
jgi:hypothetical protein